MSFPGHHLLVSVSILGLAVPATVSPPIPQDSDGDGLADSLEVKLGTDPDVADELVALTGAVRLPDGAPAVGSPVWVHGGIVPCYRTTTDALGRFHIEDWPEVLLPRVVHAKGLAAGYGALYGETTVDAEARGGPQARGVDVAPSGGAAVLIPTIRLRPGLRSRLFGQPRIFDVVGNDVAVGDFDGDGFADFVTDLEGRTSSSETVQVYLSGPGGAWELRQEFAADPVEKITLGDVNDDGALDFVTTGTNFFEPDAKVYLGMGDGTFAIPLAIPDYFLDAALGDFDQDGFVDVLGNQDFLTLVRGNGDGTFQAPIDLVAVPTFLDIEAADLDDDGDLDVVGCMTFPRSVHVFLNNGRGGFPSQTVYPVSTPVQDVELGDVDGNGLFDIGTAGLSGLRLFPGIGGGAFGSEFVVDSRGLFFNEFGMKIVDYDCDGSLDLARAGGILVNQGGFSFQPNDLDSSGLSYGVEGGDFNGDGLFDLLSTGGGVFLALNEQGVGGEATAVTPLLGTGRALAEGDFDGNGIPDLAVWMVDAVEVFGGAGDGSFFSLFRDVLPPQSGGRPPLLRVADFDADGQLDLVTSFEPPGSAVPAGVRLYRGTPGGGFEPAFFQSTPEDIDLLEVGDVDGDGLPDLVARLNSALGVTKWSWLPSVANGTFGAAVDVGLPGPTAPRDFAMADLNGDGAADAVLVYRTGTFTGNIQVYLGGGDGTFSFYRSLPTSEPFHVGLEDLDQDGGLDALVLSTDGESELSVFPLGADGSLLAPTTYAVPFTSDLLVVDVDLDGIRDVVGSGTVLFGDDSTRPFGFEAFSAGTFGIFSGAVADFDLDGVPDVASFQFPPGSSSSQELEISFGLARR